MKCVFCDKKLLSDVLTCDECAERLRDDTTYAEVRQQECLRDIYKSVVQTRNNTYAIRSNTSCLVFWFVILPILGFVIFYGSILSALSQIVNSVPHH